MGANEQRDIAMIVSKFEVPKTRGLNYAACDAVPVLMVIAGPNGAGKSTLLNALRRAGPERQMLYIGPHRASRKQNVEYQHLLGHPLLVSDMLTRFDTPGFNGINFLTGARDPWNSDDSGNYLKHALCQIQTDFEQAIASHFQIKGEIARGSIPDPWLPLREVTDGLLPHLKFSKIDTSNRSHVRCTWARRADDGEVDYDDLSSGEKSIIQIFFPLVEKRVRARIQSVRSGNAGEVAVTPICLLIDEPELHLHPNLQIKLFDYLRLLAAEGYLQVIMTTHSPTIVEHASFDELYVLRPPSLVSSPSDNQLSRVATDEEKLSTLRHLFGTTSNITAMQPVIVVEGAYDTAASAVVGDRKLYRALHKGFDQALVIPGGSKGECIKLVRLLNNALPDLSPRLRAIALIDRDLSKDEAEGVTFLPVSMIENLLLDPEVLWDTLESVRERSSFKSAIDVERTLDAILAEMEGAETERAGKVKVGFSIFRPNSPLTSAPSQAADFATRLLQNFSDARIADALREARLGVDAAKTSNRRRETFDGKSALHVFHTRHVHATGMARHIFTFLAAKRAREKKTVSDFFER